MGIVICKFINLLSSVLQCIHPLLCHLFVNDTHVECTRPSVNSTNACQMQPFVRGPIPPFCRGLLSTLIRSLFRPTPFHLFCAVCAPSAFGKVLRFSLPCNRSSLQLVNFLFQTDVETGPRHHAAAGIVLMHHFLQIITFLPGILTWVSAVSDIGVARILPASVFEMLPAADDANSPSMPNALSFGCDPRKRGDLPMCSRISISRSSALNCMTFSAANHLSRSWANSMPLFAFSSSALLSSNDCSIWAALCVTVPNGTEASSSMATWSTWRLVGWPVVSCDWGRACGS